MHKPNRKFYFEGVLQQIFPRRTILICFAVFIAATSSAQSINPCFQALSKKNGLSDDHQNRHVFQDSKGFSWISTSDGLNRFDGSAVKTYGFEDGMLDKNIQSNFFEDYNSNIWFSTYERINCYQRALDTIVTYRVRDSANKEIKENYIAFSLDSLGRNLWTKAGEFIYNLNIDQPTKFNRLPNKTIGFSFLVEQNIDGSPKQIIASPSLYGTGIEIYDLDNNQQKKYSKRLKEYLHIPKTIYLKDSLLLSIHKDKLILFSQNPQKQEKLIVLPGTGAINDILAISGDLVILSTKSTGLLLYDWSKEKVVAQWNTNENVQNSISSSNPLTLNTTKNQFLWVTQNDLGLDYSYLHHISFGLPTQGSLQSTCSITQHTDQTVWVGDVVGGHTKYSAEGEIINKLEYGSQLKQQEASWSFLRRNSESYYWSTTSNLFLANFVSGEINKVETPDTLTFRNIYHIPPNRTWAFSNKQVVEIKNNGKHYFTEPVAELCQYNSFTFLNLFITKDHQLYLPYNANEIWLFEITEDEVKLNKKLNSDLQFFGFFESCIHKNLVWAATNKGLYKIINDTLLKPAISEDHALRNGNTYQVVEDRSGDLWIGTNNGLWRYSSDTSKHKFLHFTEKDGLPSNIFPRNGSNFILANDGAVWMGTNKGPIRFHPDDIKVPDHPPHIYLEHLIINDTEKVKAIGEKESISLAYNKNTLTFEPIAISYLKPEQSKIHYRLNGYDDKWLQIGPGERIRYTKLPHGKYELELKAENSWGQESEIHELQITIATPYWKTWWFLLLCGAVLSAVLFLIYRKRMQYLIAEEAKKTAIAQLETQVLEVEMVALKAQMNPHFLFNAMNSIKGIIIDDDGDKAADYLTQFSLLLRTILSNSEKPVVSLSKELEALELYINIEALRFERKLEYRILIDETVDTSFSEIPPLTLQPFVENAIWHGLLPKKEGQLMLLIRINRDGDLLVIEIEDNGIGRRAAGTTTDRKSMGIDITRKRMKILHAENEVKIVDLIDPDGKALGTNVVLTFLDPE